MNQASVFEWHKRFKEGRESVRDDERCGMSKEVPTPKLIGQRVRVRVTILRFYGSSGRDSFKSVQCHFHQDNAPAHNSVLVTDYLTKMGIKIVRHHPYSPDFAPCDFSLFPKLRCCHYETIRWKRLWRRSSTHSHKRASMGPSRICWNGTTSALQPEGLLRRGLQFHVCTINKNAHTEKVWKLI